MDNLPFIKLPKKSDEETTPLAEETTTGGFQLATRVEANPKCRGCLNYDDGRSLCLKATYPSKCGDGSNPSKGYAPADPDFATIAAFRARSMNAEAPQAGDMGHEVGEEPMREVSLEDLAQEPPDEPMAKSRLKRLKTVKKGLHDNLASFSKEWKTSDHTARMKLATAHLSHAPFQQHLQRLGATGSKVRQALMAHVNSKANVNLAGAKVMVKGRWSCSKCGYALAKAGACSKCGFKVLKSLKKADGGEMSVMHPPQSDTLRSVRMRQTTMKMPAAHTKAKQAGGGKVFAHHALAAHLGVPSDTILNHAVGSQHVSHFVSSMRQMHGPKLKGVTDGQLRSAYHSTGLMHSLTHRDVSLVKSLLMSKKGVLGHTSSGKPVTRTSAGAHAFSDEDHEDAEQLHSHVARVASDMSYRAETLPALRRHLQKLANKHRALAARHRASLTPTPTSPQPVEAPQPFSPPTKKGFMLSSNPTDTEIAKALVAGGGAEALVQGGFLNVPMHLRAQVAAHAEQRYGLPGDGDLVVLPPPEPPKVDAPLFPRNVVGGPLEIASGLSRAY